MGKNQKPKKKKTKPHVYPPRRSLVKTPLSSLQVLRETIDCDTTRAFPDSCLLCAIDTRVRGLLFDMACARRCDVTD